MLANQIRPTTLSAAIVSRYIRFWPKKHRELLPFLAIAKKKSLKIQIKGLRNLELTKDAEQFFIF